MAPALDFPRARGDFGARNCRASPCWSLRDSLRTMRIGRGDACEWHQVHDLTPEEVSKGMAEGRYLLVDVREPNEVAVEAYPDGVVVPLSTFDPQAHSGSAGQAGGVRLPLRQALGDGLAGGAGGGPCLRQASGRWHPRLEGRGTADQDRRLTSAMTSMNKVFADLPVTVFEAMSQARARQQRHQSRPGLSRRSRAGGHPPRRGRRGR